MYCIDTTRLGDAEEGHSYFHELLKTTARGEILAIMYVEISSSQTLMGPINSRIRRLWREVPVSV